MKICYISNLYPPHVRGGAERVVARLAAEEHARGHLVHVITSAPLNRVQFSEHISNEAGVIVHRIFHWTFFFNIDSGHQALFARLLNLKWSLVNFLFAWRVARILRKIKPDVVHTHNLAGTSFLLPALIKALGIKHIHTVHDVQLAVASGRLCVGEEFDWIHAGFLARGFQFFQRALWASPSVVTAPSAWLLDYYRSKNIFRTQNFRLCGIILERQLRRGQIFRMRMYRAQSLRFFMWAKSNAQKGSSC